MSLINKDVVDISAFSKYRIVLIIYRRKFNYIDKKCTHANNYEVIPGEIMRGPQDHKYFGLIGISFSSNHRIEVTVSALICF